MNSEDAATRELNLALVKIVARHPDRETTDDALKVVGAARQLAKDRTVRRDDSLEVEILKWREKRWPKPNPQSQWDALKVCEEAGEVAGAVSKLQEGRGGVFGIADEIGDTLIALSVLAARFGWSLEDLREQRWKEVQDR